MESEMDLEKEDCRSRLASEEESNNNSYIGGAELTSMEIEESDASTASLTQNQQQQQQQRKLWRSKSTNRSQELSLESTNSSAVTNEELKELKQWFQWEKSLSIDAAIHQERLVWQRQQRGTRCGTMAENERLKERVQVLGQENYELTRMLKNERIRNRDEDASQRRSLRQAAAKARLETRAARRLQVMEAAAVQQAQMQIKQLEETVEEKDKTIAKLEAEKYYLGERIFELTGVEEGFWSDEILTKPVISERERGLLQRANSLNIHVSQLQRQQRILSSENEQLKRQMEMERERPAGQLQRERERQQELQLLRKKNAELAIQTKKLEEKVRSLEKKSKELPSVNGGTQQVVLSRERSIDNKLHHQQVQQQQQHAKQTTGPTKWREKEMAMQTLQNRLTEREKEIGRLKEKLRDLTKKLQQEQHYNSKESLQQQQNGAEWTILSQGSRELEGLLKLVSKERLQLERNFVLATQGLQRSAELDVNRYSALEATNVQLRRQVEQLELLCKEQAEAAQQLSKRQQDREVLAERLKAKSEYSQDLENQLSKVIDKNAELTIENCDLKKQVQELHQFEAECVTLRSSLSTVESQCQAAQSEVAQLKEKMAGLDHVLRQMREAAEKKKELEKQHAESVNELRTAQAQLGLLASNICNQSGSERKTCNIVTGQCECRPNVVGLKCDQCQVGFWNLISGRGCQSCGCDGTGAVDRTCHPTTGACYCLPGVGGQTCDRCLPGFFGFSSSGCRECEPCNKPGHICDPDTGRCVCPTGTEGSQCQSCSVGTWNHNPVKGCKNCNCHPQGSRSSQCDLFTGACACRPGYAGTQCDRCVQPGFYGFPQCQRCDCHPTGTDTRSNGAGLLIGCNQQDGQCLCKANVMGRRCDTCKESTFGLLNVAGTEQTDQQLHQELTDSFVDDGGCTPCFCFGRSSSCTQAQLFWSQMKVEGSRGLMITYDPPGPDAPNNIANPNQFPVNTQEICYINLALPGDGQLQFKTGETQLNVTNNLRIVPDVRGDVMIGVSQYFDTPLYWQLPASFAGDRTTSYNGLLRFTVTNHGGSTLFPDNILATYPLVQIQGNRKVILEYYPPAPHPNGRYQVRLHETLWRMKNNPQAKVSRAMMMIALQNVQHILIRATDSMDRIKAELKDVSLEVAIPAALSNSSTHRNSPVIARGVEMCQCPSEYTGGSCQDPHRGYYRRFKYEHVSSIVLIELVGEAYPCHCNGRSETCDRETGRCTNCRESTTGDHCQQCAKGYYGEPNHPGGCRPCACPSIDRNFADSCQLLRNGSQSCSCARGFRGDRCQKCDYGYYGNPSQGVPCQPCLCNVNGSVSDECHEVTGHCNCKPGITGRDCTYCAPRHVISPTGCTSCEDGCTGALFDEVDQMASMIARYNFTDYVPLPWTGLFHQQNTTILLEQTLIEKREENEIIDRLINAPNILPLAQITLQRSKELETLATGFQTEASDLEPICTQALEASILVTTIMEEIIAYLKNYAIGETPSININKALAEAENHWQYIQSIDVDTRKTSAIKELERSRNLLNSIKNLFDDGSDTAQVRDNLEGFKIRLDDLENYIYKSRNSTEAAFRSLSNSNSTLDAIRHSVGEITSKSTQIDIDLNLARKKNVNASLAISRARVGIQGLATSLDNLKNKKTQCAAKESELSRLNPEYKRKYVTAAQEHANNLWQQAQALFNQFNATRDVADHPLQAANAYRSIVEALKLARQAAEAAGEAAETAYGRAYPEDMDLSLVEQARLSREKSRELLRQSERLQVVVSNHKEQLKGEQIKLDSVEMMLKKAKSIYEETTANMDKLPQVRDRAKAAVEKSTDALSKSTTVSKQVMDIKSQIDSELRVRLLAMQNSRNVGLGNIPKLVDDARKNMKHLDVKITHLTKKNFEFRSINSSVSLKLDELRKKIKRAKQAASSIRVSLSGNSGSCSRSFTPPLQPSSMSSIMMTYAFNHKDRDSLLFYLPATKKYGNDQETDFLAVEMVDRQIRFLWNAGGGTTVLTHPLKLQPGPDDLSNDFRWYKIEAERTGNVGSLRVRTVKPENDGDIEGVTVTGAGPPRFSKVDMTTGDKLYIGRVPDNSPSDLKTSKFSGHLHQMWYDGQPIGLWNFMSTSAGCGPSIEGAQEAKDESSFRFNGQGYAELAQIPRYDSRQYSITFSFKSLDENALLFLAINETHLGQYISLELTEGLIRYQVRYGSGYEMSLQSRQKYNTGQWVKVEASRVLIRGVETALLKVADDEELSAAPFNFGVPDLELEEAKLYVGGLPPDVSISQDLMGSVPGSFLGCMKDLQVVAFGMNPLQGSFYGVEASCSSQTINKIVAFAGTGYIQLRAARPTGRDLTLGLSFKTEAPEGILLFSAPIPAEASDEPAHDEDLPVYLPLKSDKEADMISLTMRQGKVEARFRSSPAEVVSITSSETYNDGQFHGIVVVRTGRKVEVLVDDISIGTLRLARPTGSSSSGSDFSHLMLGGVRPEWLSMAADFIGTQHSFTGCIADLSFNNQLVDLSYPVRHSAAAVGRCQHIPVPRVLEERMQANENALSSCREVPQYTIEGRAFKFGDAPNSHVMISANRKELHSSFNFTMDFRTHYPNGLLLFSSMKQKKAANYLLVALKNGKVVVSLHGRRKEDLISAGSVNDGLWHRVHIIKDKRKVVVMLDDFAPLRAKAPNKLQLDGQLFVGGLPENSLFLDNAAAEGFKGCIRNLNLNGRSHDLASSKNVIQRVGQCFAHVETGSYFPGDAYAVYSEDFRVGAMADIQLEFRTTELNGVLLSVSERKGSPSLSLAIDDGTIVFAVDMGDNRTFSVSQSFPSTYQLCDNRWHSVKANYVENALTLKVDNQDEQYGFSTNGHVKEAKTRNPLFIGGLPELEPQGALRVRDNFKGCIRNVVIRGEIKDWTDMARLNNVLLNACPTN